jgi:glycosyltransferase involved in cell wall biosynthesis
MLWFRIVLKRLYDAAFVPGKRGRRFLRLLGMPDNRIFEGVYTADGNIFYPPKKPGAERSGIVFAGQFIKRKGIPAIIGAWRIFGKNKRDIPLELIGAGPLQNEILNAGLPAEPFKLAPELANEYRNASAFLLPSTLDHWGVVVHEAALSGCLLLVTRQCAATDDLLEHGVNGFLMKKSAASEIIKAVDWLQSLTPEQIETGRRRSLELAAKFSPTRWAETTRKLLMLTR